MELVSTLSPDLKIEASSSSYEVTLNKEPLASPHSVVRFSIVNDLYPTISREQMSSTERRASWYKPSELKKMRRAFDDSMLGRGEQSDDDSFCEIQRALHQLMAVSVVLDEQERQRKESDNDADLVSQKYQEFVRHSRGSIFVSKLVHKEQKRKERREPLTDRLVL